MTLRLSNEIDSSAIIYDLVMCYIYKMEIEYLTELTVISVIHATKDDNPNHRSNHDTSAEYVFSSNLCINE